MPSINTSNVLVAFLYHYHLNNHKIDSELEYQYCAPSRNEQVYEIYMKSIRNTRIVSFLRQEVPNSSRGDIYLHIYQRKGKLTHPKEKWKQEKIFNYFKPLPTKCLALSSLKHKINARKRNHLAFFPDIKLNQY